MKQAARDREHREPAPYVRPERPRTYGDAVDDQRRRQRIDARIEEIRRAREADPT